MLFESQRDFNYLDTDTLKNACTVDNNAIRVGNMTYKALIVDGLGYTDPETIQLLEPMIDAGLVISYRDEVPGIPSVAADPGALVIMLDYLVQPDVTVIPSNSDLRYYHVRHDDADFYLFANEGREPIAGHKELAHKIAQLERKLGDHDEQIMVLVEAIKQLMDPKPPPKPRRIGFHPD